MFQFEKQVALPGQYTFPFRVLVPKNCPSSMKYKGGIGSKGTVEYTIEASLVPHHSQKIQPMTYKCPLLINQDPYEIKHDITESINMQIKKFIWFFGKGTAKLSTKLDKSAYHSGERIKVL